jgi:hypothetical protein
MFDYNLILMDGSVVTTTVLDTPATSLTRGATTGAAVVDIGAGGTPADGLVAVLMLSTLAVGAAAYTLTSYIQASDVLAFTSDIHNLGSFDVAGATGGVILGAETPCVAMIRFATPKRYIRINATVSNDFGYIKCYLTPYPFRVL